MHGTKKSPKETKQWVYLYRQFLLEGPSPRLYHFLHDVFPFVIPPSLLQLWLVLWSQVEKMKAREWGPRTSGREMACECLGIVLSRPPISLWEYWDCPCLLQHPSLWVLGLQTSHICLASTLCVEQSPLPRSCLTKTTQKRRPVGRSQIFRFLKHSHRGGSGAYLWIKGKPGSQQALEQPGLHREILSQTNK